MIDWLSIHWFDLATFRGFQWGNAIFLYLLPAVPVLLLMQWLFHFSFRKKFDVALRKEWQNTNTLVQIARLIPGLLFMLFLCLVIIALARPQRTDERSVQYREGIDIILVLDISESMMIEDFKPNRLEAAKEVANNFIKGRNNDRIGIILFSGQAFTLCPPTTDYQWLRDMLGQIKYGMIADDGTAIGDAIGTGINHLKQSNSRSKVLVLISDGENTTGLLDPKKACELAYAYNIRIYPIGIGIDGLQPYGHDEEGKVRYVQTYLDEISLNNIADKTKGKFFRAQNKTALAEIFQRINNMEKTPIKEDRLKNQTDYYQIYLTWAIVCFLLWLSLKNSFLNNFLED